MKTRAALAPLVLFAVVVGALGVPQAACVDGSPGCPDVIHTGDPCSAEGIHCVDPSSTCGQDYYCQSGRFQPGAGGTCSKDAAAGGG